MGWDYVMEQQQSTSTLFIYYASALFFMATEMRTTFCWRIQLVSRMQAYTNPHLIIRGNVMKLVMKCNIKRERHATRKRNNTRPVVVTADGAPLNHLTREEMKRSIELGRRYQHILRWMEGRNECKIYYSKLKSTTRAFNPADIS